MVVLRPLRSITRGPRTVIEKRKSFIRLGDFQGFQGASIRSLHPPHQPGLLHTESLTPTGLSLEGTEVFCAHAAQHALGDVASSTGVLK